jgi:UDP-3-O-[3-hydroxymyristoyl] glucosamine N-acyltransferase
MEHVGFNSACTLEELVRQCEDILGGGKALAVRKEGCLPEKIIGVSDGRSPAPGTVCFLEKVPSAEAAEGLKQVLVITTNDVASSLQDCSTLAVQDPRALFIRLVKSISSHLGFSFFTSEVADSPRIHPDADIHPRAVIDEGVFIGAGAVISAGCVIKRGSHIASGAVIRENTVIGCDGIALYKTHEGEVLRFPHLAGVVIEEGVEIGASCVLPRGVLRSSRIGSGTVIGNLSNIGHAVRIGQKVWMSVGCLIGGNTLIGDGSTLGLGVSVRDNLVVGSRCSIGMGSVVLKDLPDNSSVLGNPARRLPELDAGPQR